MNVEEKICGQASFLLEVTHFWGVCEKKYMEAKAPFCTMVQDRTDLLFEMLSWVLFQAFCVKVGWQAGDGIKLPTRCIPRGED